MDSQEKESKTSIRIVDRRRFDSEGDERSTEQQNETKSLAQPVLDSSKQSIEPKINVTEINSIKDKSEQAIMDESLNTSRDLKNDDDSMSDISFSSFVLSMATQALMLLGQIPAPDGVTLSVDPIAAKQSIDILTMLDEKTKGNLNAQESMLLKDALHNLRIAYLQLS